MAHVGEPASPPAMVQPELAGEFGTFLRAAVVRAVAPTALTPRRRRRSPSPTSVFTQATAEFRCVRARVDCDWAENGMVTLSRQRQSDYWYIPTAPAHPVPPAHTSVTCHPVSASLQYQASPRDGCASAAWVVHGRDVEAIMVDVD